MGPGYEEGTVGRRKGRRSAITLYVARIGFAQQRRAARNRGGEIVAEQVKNSRYLIALMSRYPLPPALV